MTILMDAPHAAAYRFSVNKLALLAFFSDLLTYCWLCNTHALRNLCNVDASIATKIEQKRLKLFFFWLV